MKKWKAIWYILNSKNIILLHDIKERRIGDKYYIKLKVLRHTHFIKKGDIDVLVKAVDIIKRNQNG